MSNCIELSYDRFGLQFSNQLIFSSPMMLQGKVIPASTLAGLDANPYLQVGNFLSHTGNRIRANDTSDNVTTSIKETKKDKNYTVDVHFEFKKPTAEAITLCQDLDITPRHIILLTYNLTGGVAERRVVRADEGQMRATLTDNKGIVSIDISVVNTNGIQLVI